MMVLDRYSEYFGCESGAEQTSEAKLQLLNFVFKYLYFTQLGPSGGPSSDHTDIILTKVVKVHSTMQDTKYLSSIADKIIDIFL